MNSIWLILFVLSLFSLFVILMRHAMSIRWLGFLLGNLVLAGVAIYLFNGLGIVEGVTLPLNAFTLFVMGWLGAAGVLLVVGIITIVL